MTEPQFDITPFLATKVNTSTQSLFEGARGQTTARPPCCAGPAAAAFANAEGGILILGIEDDRSLTGHRLPADALSSPARHSTT